MTTTFTSAEIHEMQRRIGHSIPRPYSQTLLEDLTVMPDDAKRRGEGKMLMDMASQIYSSDGE